MDCRRCRFCKDLPKYGGPGKVRQKCIARQCLRRSKILYTEESLQAGRPVLQEDMAAELRALGISIPQINDPMFFIEDIGAEEGTDPAAAEGAKESVVLINAIHVCLFVYLSSFHFCCCCCLFLGGFLGWGEELKLV